MALNSMIAQKKPSVLMVLLVSVLSVNMFLMIQFHAQNVRRRCFVTVMGYLTALVLILQKIVKMG